MGPIDRMEFSAPRRGNRIVFTWSRPMDIAARFQPTPRSGVKAGAVIEARNAGGGGYGAPSERAPELLRADVVNGVVSAHAAEAIYGAPQ